MPNLILFREWMLNILNIKPISIVIEEKESLELSSIQESAKKEFQKSFDRWQYQFYSN